MHKTDEEKQKLNNELYGDIGDNEGEREKSFKNKNIRLKFKFKSIWFELPRKNSKYFRK